MKPIHHYRDGIKYLHRRKYRLYQNSYFQEVSPATLPILQARIDAMTQALRESKRTTPQAMLEAGFVAVAAGTEIESKEQISEIVDFYNAPFRGTFTVANESMADTFHRGDVLALEAINEGKGITVAHLKIDQHDERASRRALLPDGALCLVALPTETGGTARGLRRIRYGTRAKDERVYFECDNAGTAERSVCIDGTETATVFAVVAGVVAQAATVAQTGGAE